MTHYNTDSLEVVTDEELAKQYDMYLDDSGEYDGLIIDGVDLVPSEVLKKVNPIAYEDRLDRYINSLYDVGVLTSEWDRAEHVKDLCRDWAYYVLGEVVALTTEEEDKIVFDTLFELYDEHDVLEVDSGEIVLNPQHTMSEVLIALGTALNETKNNE